MKIGQIVYNLQDYDKLLSSNKDSFNTLISSNSPDYETKKVNIFEDLIKNYNLKSINKLGIQAPMGTKFKLGSNKNMIIGHTGIYELDDVIVVNYLQFEKPENLDLYNIIIDFAYGEED